MWPLSLQAVRATAFAYTLPRKPVTSADPFMTYFNQQIQKVKPFSDTSQSSKIGCCHDKNTSKDNDNLETAEDTMDTVDLSKLSSVITKNFESDVTTKHTEELFTKQDEDSSSVMEVDEKCKDSADCGLMQNVDYSETPEIRETKESISRSKCVEQLNSLRHLCQRQKAQKETKKLIHPIQQMSVTWGDAASELSAGKSLSTTNL